MNVREAVNALLSAPAFQALEGHLRDPSLFHILKIENRERSHAACLAWLLDPRGSHGMGSTPLRTFMLLGTAAAAEAGVEGMLDATDVDGLDLNGVLATAEYVIPDGRRPDLVVLDAEDHLLMIVEYKVDAIEGVDQTASYAAWAKTQTTEAGGRCRLPMLIFLCPDRSDETEPTPPFTHLKYEAYCAWLAGLNPLA